jgi:hypothetical protein
MSLAQNCALEAYALVKDVYVSECKICVKPLRLITEKRLDITTCVKIVYEQLKVYKQVYVKPLAKQLIQCEKKHFSATKRNQIISDYLTKPILTGNVRLSMG